MWRVTVSSRRSRLLGSRSSEAGVARSSETGMTGSSSGLLGVPPVGGDLREGRGPDAGGVFHVIEHLAQAGEARGTADDLRMKGEVGDAVRLRDAVELRQPSLQHRSRRLDAPLPREHKEGRVVQPPRHGNLHGGGAGGLGCRYGWSRSIIFDEYSK